MLCRICGTPIKAGEKFCSLCGEKAEVAEETQRSEYPYSQLSESQQLYGGQSYSQRSDNQQPYGGQSYRQEASRQAYRQQQSGRKAYRGQQSGGQPYGQYFNQPFDQQSSGNYYYGTPVKSKKWLWITLGFIAAAAIAAVLIFAVPWNQEAAVLKVKPPFKGDTPQTQFANDTAKVMSDSLAIFGDVGIDFNEIAEKPFDMKMDLKMKSMGQELSGNFNMAYDNENLGMNISAEGVSVKVLLIDDVMYMEVLNSVYGIDFNSKEDLSQPMTLKDRMMALELYAQQDISSEEGYINLAGLILQNMLIEGDYSGLAELLLNSIDESCFESSGSKTTLTLHAQEVADTLRTFAKKLEENEALKKLYEVFVKESAGTFEDAIKQINDAADALEEHKETSDFEIVWEVSYENENPVAFAITADVGGKEYAYSYEYKHKGDSTDITFEIVPGSASASMTGNCNFKKTGSGTEFVGTIIMQGQTLSIPGGITFNFYGNIAFSGNNVHGTVTIKVPDSFYIANGMDAEQSFDFNITVNTGMPGIKVKDDGRFKIDTSDATIYDESLMNNPYGFPGMY